MLDVQDAFNLMRPLCVRLTKEFTKDNMMEVTKAFESLPEMCCRELTEYVVFPFRFHLRRLERTDGLVAQLFECLSSILKKAAVDSYSLFSDIFMQVFVKISSPKEDNKSIFSELIKLKISIYSSFRSQRRSEGFCCKMCTFLGVKLLYKCTTADVWSLFPSVFRSCYLCLTTTSRAGEIPSSSGHCYRNNKCLGLLSC
ncbi:TELO2-interacting protein 1 homolog isoform X2 [Tachypleus tridentatus]|uniref:TELO2-interacting protein 1 homolog isoform X2 n=1 Tax=Tachypleus tridentatus TaxID=6853 RepID=UPI003FD4A931